MTTRIPTLDRPSGRVEPPEPRSTLRPWHAAVLLGLLIAAGLAVVVLLQDRAAEVAPAEPDADVVEPQAPAAPAEPREPAQPQEPAQPREPAQPAPEVVYGEEARANWDVTGVPAGDRLNVRSGPGVGSAITAGLAPDTAELESTGRIATVDGVLWREIVIPGDGTGWVNASFLTETRPPGIADGRHATYLHGIDAAGRTLSVDVIQFLTGQEAIDAYRQAYPDDPTGPPNDYFVVNDNPRLRELAVSPEVRVQVVRLGGASGADPVPGSWGELPTHLSANRPGDGRLSWNPFWITVEGGAITRIEEQYIP